MLEFMLVIQDINIIIYIIKIFFINIFTYYTIIKMLDRKEISKREKTIFIVISILISILIGITKYISNVIISNICLILLLSILYSKTSKCKIGNSIILNTISLGINYCILFISTTISFVPNVLIQIQNDYLSLLLIICIHFSLLYLFFKIKKFKHGFLFLKKENNNEYFDILTLNISIIILFSSIIFTNLDSSVPRSLFIGFILFLIIMFVTIKKSIELNYKQKLLIQDLTETKKELQSKNQRIQELEKENLKISKTNHSINHKQESLEHKLDELMLKTEISSELTIKDQINQISNQLTNKIATPELPKTNIEQIDDMLKYMQSECTKNKIDFNLQIKGNIYQMTNNYIPKEDLEILLADHIRNAIIAINHSNNVNRSILVRLGKLDGTYSLYIYDSGIEFEVSTLTTLGITPSTTHKDKGGTGMGFMNTFDTLNKTKSSIIINEYNKPTKENYTKSIMIKCDNKNEYKIFSYRAKEIEKTDQNNRLILIDTSKKEN